MVVDIQHGTSRLYSAAQVVGAAGCYTRDGVGHELPCRRHEVVATSMLDLDRTEMPLRRKVSGQHLGSSIVGVREPVSATSYQSSSLPVTRQRCITTNSCIDVPGRNLAALSSSEETVAVQCLAPSTDYHEARSTARNLGKASRIDTSIAATSSTAGLSPELAGVLEQRRLISEAPGGPGHNASSSRAANNVLQTQCSSKVGKEDSVRVGQPRELHQSMHVVRKGHTSSTTQASVNAQNNLDVVDYSIFDTMVEESLPVSDQGADANAVKDAYFVGGILTRKVLDIHSENGSTNGMRLLAAAEDIPHEAPERQRSSRSHDLFSTKGSDPVVLPEWIMGLNVAAFDVSVTCRSGDESVGALLIGRSSSPRQDATTWSAKWESMQADLDRTYDESIDELSLMSCRLEAHTQC